MVSTDAYIIFVTIAAASMVRLHGHCLIHDQLACQQIERYVLVDRLVANCLLTVTSCRSARFSKAKCALGMSIAR